MAIDIRDPITASWLAGEFLKPHEQADCCCMAVFLRTSIQVAGLLDDQAGIRQMMKGQ